MIIYLHSEQWLGSQKHQQVNRTVIYWHLPLGRSGVCPPPPHAALIPGNKIARDCSFHQALRQQVGLMHFTVNPDL